MMTYSIADLMESIADVIPDREAVICGEDRRTYAELDRRANRLAHWLSSQGVGAGDHVGLYMWNHIAYVEAMLACHKLSAVHINVNYRYVAEELRYLFDDADLKAVLCVREYAPLVAEVAGSVEGLDTFLYLEDETGASLDGLDWTEYEAAMAAGSEARGFPARSDDDLYIVYTGGTTGMPRGVMWRHEDLFFAALQGGKPGRPDKIGSPEELAAIAEKGHFKMVTLPTAAFIHGAAQWAAWIAFFAGGKVVIKPGKSFDPVDSLTLVQEEKVTTIILIGDAMARPIADLLEEDPEAYDLSSLMVIVSGGAILSDSVRDQLEEQIPGTMILNNFGASEAGHQGTAFPGAGRNADGKLKFFMNDSVGILDDDLKPVAPGSGQIGMLARKGYMPLGYYNDQAKTEATFKVDSEGTRWVIPGDMAILEEDGMVVVLGRGSVCINTGGEKVFPEEVEEGLKAHGAIFDAVVVGLPDSRWGERVAALVEIREDYLLDEEEVDEHIREFVAGYKAPRDIFFVEKIVRHPSGKPDYRWAKDTASAMAAPG